MTTYSNQTHHSQKTKHRQATGKPSACKPHQLESMELASLIWNSEMHCIFAIAEHQHTNFPTHSHCDSCGDKFLHSSWPGGLVIIQRQDEIRFELQYLAARARVPPVDH